MTILTVLNVMINLISKMDILIINAFLYSTLLWATTIKIITQIVNIIKDLEIKS